MIGAYNEDIFRAVLTFDNGATYEALTSNENDKVITSLTLTEQEAITAGNPLGVLTANTLTIAILDAEDKLLISNSSSPYYGYMRQGVKVELFKGSTPYGTYYTDAWDTGRSDGGYDETVLSCQDYLTFLGNQELPALEAYSGISVTHLLGIVLQAAGLTESQYVIDPSLNLDLLYSITKGERVRDVLNGLAQALIARITINRSNVVEIKPAFRISIPEGEVKTVDYDNIYTTSTKNNLNAVYNRVKIVYAKQGSMQSDTLANVSNITAKKNTSTTIPNIGLTTSVLSIDAVNFEYDLPDGMDVYDNIDRITYKGFSGGIDVVIHNKADVNITGTLIVEGRAAGTTDASVSGVVSGSSTVGNTLIIESQYIQDTPTAQTYLNSVIDYLKIMAQELHITDSVVSPELQTGDYIRLANSTTTGLYYVMGITITIVEDDYSLTAALVKVGE